MVCTILLVFATPAALAQNAKQVAHKTFPSVVMLIMEDRNGQPLSLGSGFFVREDVVATNFHVIAGASAGYARIINQKTRFEIAGTVGSDRQADIALLKLSGARANPLPLSGGNVEVGDEIYAVGNPQGLEGTFSEGIVSGIREVGTDRLIQITAPISPGSSGGPVLDTQGNVVGVAAATLANGQNLNFAIPVSYLRKILSDTPRQVTTLNPAELSKSAQSILDQVSGPGNQGVVGTKWAWTNAPYEFAFSLTNRLNEPVKNVYCVFVFYDQSGEPVHFVENHFQDVIPSGLARRVSQSTFTSSGLTQLEQGMEAVKGLDKLTQTLEIRVLDFQIVTAAEAEKARKKKR